MQTQLQELTIENFANGAANALFLKELQAVLENIDDPNIVKDHTRTISLKFKIKPDAHADQAAISVSSVVSLAPCRPAAGMSYFGRQNGKLTAYSHDINQMELNLETKPEVVREA